MIERIATVTGAAGFIGSHLVSRLLAEGYRVRLVDNLSTGKRENLPRPNAQAEVRIGCLLDPQVAREAVEGADVVFHIAALGSVTRSMENPLRTHTHNTTATINVLEAARAAGVRRVVYASSSSVYGEARELPRRETQEPRPLSPYAVSKLTSEQYCRVYAQQFGLETVSLRYFNVFGPRQDARSQYAAVIPRFIESACNGRSPVVYGDGRQTRDFTHVDNVVSANLLAAEAPGLSGEVFNIGTGQSVSLLDLLAFISRKTGFAMTPRFEPSRSGDVRDSLACIDKARGSFGYEPLVSCFEGVGRLLQDGAGAG